MEAISVTECSKTSPYASKQNQTETESEENEGESRPINGASSSNSTAEDHNDKKPSVRPYIRSKMPRLRWTSDLHLQFVHAIERLGGQERATPKLVLQLMNTKGLSIAHVKSHLQMYRSKKIDDQGQRISYNRNLVESGDRTIYSLSQLPMLQGYSNHHQGDNSSASLFRSCGDSLMRQYPYASSSFTDEPRPGLRRTVTGRIFGSNNGTINWANYNFKMGSSPFNALPTWKSHEVHKNELSLQVQHRLGPIETNHKSQKLEDHTNLTIHTGPSFSQDCKATKRKIADCNLDLGLSLTLSQVNKDGRFRRSSEEDDVVASELSLSLHSQPLSSSKLGILKGEDDSNTESGRRVRTLDLSI